MASMGVALADIVDDRPAASPTQPAARIEGLCKRFGLRDILTEISLTVERGQVHALLGANGAGKSSIVKILAGYYSRDAGRLTVGGRDAPPSAGVRQMSALGVRVVHQDLGLVDGLSVLENVAVAGGYVHSRLGTIDWQATRARVAAALAMVGLQLAPDTEIQGLPTWQRVAVACARALYDGLDVVRLLILDEVTAALPPGEVALILDIVRRLRALGAGILYVTHRFEEVIEAADWVSVLRNGRVFQSQPLGAMTATDLVESVVGHSIVSARRTGAALAFGRPILTLEQVSTERLRVISLTLRAGEICGVIGRTGCGRSALGRTVFGQERITAGTMSIDGELLQRGGAKAAMARGIAYVPQDRQRSGVLPQASVRENLSIAHLGAVSVGGLLRGAAERRLATALVTLYGVQPANPEEDIGNLSGGNQQKVVVGRWAARDNKLFVFDEPTEGVDAGARAGIYRFIRERAAAGAAVLLLSSSIEEIVETCDRALLMRDGAIGEEIAAEDLSVKHIEQRLITGS